MLRRTEAKVVVWFNVIGAPPPRPSATHSANTRHESWATTRKHARQTRKEFVHRADLRLAASLEKERVRDYFLNNNDGWQMQTLTRHVQEDEDRERKRKEDAEAAKVRDGDIERQGGGEMPDAPPWDDSREGTCSVVVFYEHVV